MKSKRALQLVEQYHCAVEMLILLLLLDLVRLRRYNTTGSIKDIAYGFDARGVVHSLSGELTFS